MEYPDYLPAVVTYDTILTFSKEFQCIWQRRFGTGTVLYLIIRYGTILQMLFDVFRSFVKARSAVVSGIQKLLTTYLLNFKSRGIYTKIIFIYPILIFQISCKALDNTAVILEILCSLAYAGE